MTRLERRLQDALQGTAAHIEPSVDLFSRIQVGVQEDRARRVRSRRLKLASGSLVLLLAISTAIVYRNGDPKMEWWILELLSASLLSAIALVLGPFIKRFGRSYAADVFRSNPSTGKSFIVLTDFAYYLIFGAYILFTTTIDRPREWSQQVSTEQVQMALVRVGGILLIIGLLHGLNLIVLPVIGRLLTLNRRLDQQMRELAGRDMGERDLYQDDGEDI